MAAQIPPRMTDEERARQMRLQAQQPVYGPGNPPPGTPASGANPNAINVGQAAGDVVLGALSTPGAALADLARFRGAQALGGDVGTLVGGVNPRLGAAQNRISGGLSQLGQATSQAFQPVGEALSGARSTALGALGAQAAQPASQPTPVTTPGVTPTTGVQAQPQATQPMTASQVRDQDRANLAALVSSQPDFVGPQGGQPGTTLSPDILADANQRIAQTLAQSRTMGPQPGAERGDFNQATTSRVGPDGQITSTLRQPTNIIEGGYGGFGEGRGTAYLQQMAQQDQQEAAVMRERRQSAQEDVERIGLRNAMTQGTPQERRAARQQMEALDQRAEARVSEGGATERQAMQLRGAELTAQTSGAAAMQAAQTRADAQQQAAEITGRYGLQRAETTALGRIGAAQTTAGAAANTPANQRIQEQLQTAAVYDEAALQAAQNRDFAGATNYRAAAERARGITQARAQEAVTDPLTGALIGYNTAQGFRGATASEIADQRRVREQLSQQ
jgi:hypothetical protein